jgi:hypothetical protein
MMSLPLLAILACACAGPPKFAAPDAAPVPDAPPAGAWRSMSTVGAPVARYGHAAVWTGSEMIVWGGWSDDFGNLVDGGRYDPVTDTWRSMSSIGGPNTISLVWTGTELIGWDTWGVSGARYDPATDRWSPMSAIGAPSQRDSAAVAWVGDAIIVSGGTLDETTALDDGARYDPSTDTWSPIQHSPITSPRIDDTAWTGDVLIVVSDRTGAIYDPASDSWALMAVTGWPADPFLTAWIDNSYTVLAISGGTSGRYDLSTQTWQPLSPSNQPSTRFESGNVVVGNRLLVWGGRTPSDMIGDGAIYDPIADAWSVLPSDGSPPSPRAVASIVFTGNEAIVWGGFDLDGNLSTGARLQIH